jgi:hypothetical protein
MTGIKHPIKRLAGTILFAMVIAACGSNDSESTASESDRAEREAPDESPLVGTWERVTKCAELVQAFKEAGLEQYTAETLIGNGLVPVLTTSDELAKHPCKSSVPRKHSHFFTEDGEFGSLNWKGEQVDDGTYRVIDDDTFVVSKEFPDVTFNYDTNGDTITFDPVIPECSPDCFEAQWSVVVAFPGKEWHRVD